ncbi:MAG: hypothetical protein V4577_11370 [Bacteroidota bacterium]
MKFIFEINSRSELTEPAEKKHEKLMSLVKSLPQPWGLPNEVEVSFPGFKGEFTATAKLSKLLGQGIKMDVFYRYRNMLDDNHSNDDRIYIEFDSKKINYADLVLNIFPLYVKHFGAYTADIFDKQLIFKDFEEKRFANRRKVINRIYPVSFYDEQVCKSFLQRSPKQIAGLLKGHVYSAEEFHNGLMIIADTVPYTIERSVEFEAKIKSLLGY